MKKVLILVICLALCGCTTEYNLNFKEDVIQETAKAEYLKTELTDDELELVERPDYKFSLLNNDKSKYKLKTTVDGKQRQTVYSFDYNYKDFVNAKYLNDCFDAISFSNKENIIKVSLTGPFTCLYSDTMEFNLTSDYYISSQNADTSSENGVYSWTIDKENAENVNIYFNIDKTINSELKSEEPVAISSSKKSSETLITIILLLVLGFLIFRYVKMGSKEAK